MLVLMDYFLDICWRFDKLSTSVGLLNLDWCLDQLGAAKVTAEFSLIISMIV